MAERRRASDLLLSSLKFIKKFDGKILIFAKRGRREKVFQQHVDVDDDGVDGVEGEGEEESDCEGDGEESARTISNEAKI